MGIQEIIATALFIASLFFVGLRIRKSLQKKNHNCEKCGMSADERKIGAKK